MEKRTSLKEIIITCDARPSSTLDWRPLRTQALTAIASGKKILWFLDFGLFSELQKPLSDSGQFLNFSHAIDHFKDKIWSEFHKFSLGVALYRGDADYSSQYHSSEAFAEWCQERKVQVEDPLLKQLFARDVCAEYLVQLSQKILGEITTYAIFDHLPEDPLLQALLTAPDRYEEVQHYFTANKFQWKTEEEKPVGICMPSFSMADPSYLTPYRNLLQEIQDCKLIPEDQLIAAWHGLDTLYVHKQAISSSGQRKIQGFIAAGGTVIYK